MLTTKIIFEKQQQRIVGDIGRGGGGGCANTHTKDKRWMRVLPCHVKSRVGGVGESGSGWRGVKGELSQ